MLQLRPIHMDITLQSPMCASMPGIGLRGPPSVPRSLSFLLPSPMSFLLHSFFGVGARRPCRGRSRFSYNNNNNNIYIQDSEPSWKEGQAIFGMTFIYFRGYLVYVMNFVFTMIVCLNFFNGHQESRKVNQLQKVSIMSYLTSNYFYTYLDELFMNA